MRVRVRGRVMRRMVVIVVAVERHRWIRRKGVVRDVQVRVCDVRDDVRRIPSCGAASIRIFVDRV